MSDILFWNEARRELDEKKLLNKCNTFVDSLMANDYIYPHPYNETKLDDTTMDNVAGNSLSDFNRQLKKFTKLLNNRLSEAGVSAIDDNFTYHHKFVDMKGNNKGDVYLPFTLMLDDGQILLALAKIYEGKEAERKSGYQVVKWFLNEEDITKAVYGNKAREILSDKSYNELAKSISVIIKYNHKKFIKKNGSTLQKVLKDLEKENEELKARRDELLSQVELSSNTEQLGNSEELENKYIISNMGGDYIVSDKTIMENGDYKRVASINKYNGEIEFEKDVNKNEIMEFIAPFIENKFPKDKELDENLTEVSEDPLVDTKETGAKVDEELGENSADVNYNDRFVEIYNKLNLNPDDLRKKSQKIEKGNKIIYTNFFGVKDNLEPIDEYIAKIKASPEYQEYIRENTPQEEEPTNEPQDNEIETRLKALLESDDYDYVDTELDKIMENMSDEDTEKYEELMREVNNKIKQLVSNKRG